MNNNLNQYPYPEDEIDLREIIKILIDSKKLIIKTILFFTIASIIYSLSLKPEFKSSTILEIGYYEMSDGAVKLIEEPSDTISSIRANLIYKKRDDFLLENLIIKSPENKLIELQLTSKSSKKNVDLLSEISNFIDARHSNLTLLTNNQKKDGISRQIEMIESELSFIKAKQLLRQSKIEDRIAKLENELPIIDLEISQLEKVIIDDTNNLSLLKRNENLLTERAANSPNLDQIIFSYKSKINDLIIQKYTNTQETKSLNNQLKNLENVTPESYELFNLEQKQKTLENELQMLMNQTQVNTRPFGDIQTDTIKPKILLTILLGLVIGFITSIFLVLIRNFVKSYKDSQA